MRAFAMVTKVHRSCFSPHPLGLPNTNATCYRVATNRGSALFAIGTYNQHVDRRIVTITRMLYSAAPATHASHFLAIFRRWLRVNTNYLAAATITDESHVGTHLQADGWVFTSNHHGRKRWLRSL